MRQYPEIILCGSVRFKSGIYGGGYSCAKHEYSIMPYQCHCTFILITAWMYMLILFVYVPYAT